MHKTLALWRAEHANFSRLLDILDAELSVFHAGGMPRYELMQDILYYMTHYSDVLHHPKEDLVFAKLKARNSDLTALVDTLTAEHENLHALGEELVRDLDGAIDGSILPREQIETAARDYAVSLRDHMRVEETEILPWAGTLLADSDWSEISSKIRHIEDPLFGSTAEARYAALREHIAKETRASD
jgi:hemerythrin-like domain-containing protein